MKGVSMVRPNKPMENKDSGGGHGIRRILRAIVALIVSAATLLTGASTALATQAGGLPGYWYNPASDGSGWFTAWHGTSLGVVTYEGDTPIYCIEAGIVYTVRAHGSLPPTATARSPHSWWNSTRMTGVT